MSLSAIKLAISLCKSEKLLAWNQYHAVLLILGKAEWINFKNLLVRYSREAGGKKVE